MEAGSERTGTGHLPRTVRATVIDQQLPIDIEPAAIVPVDEELDRSGTCHVDLSSPTHREIIGQVGTWERSVTRVKVHGHIDASQRRYERVERRKIGQ